MTLDYLEALKELQGEFDKKYGEGVFGSIKDVTDSEDEILTTTPCMDMALGGGVPEGSWVSISGPQKYGKSTMAMMIAVAAQRQGRFVSYIDTELRAKRKSFEIQGLDESEARFKYTHSIKERRLSGDEMLDIGIRQLEKIPRMVLIIDSLSNMPDAKEQLDGVTAETRGGINKHISRFCRIASQIVRPNRSVVVGITHQMANTSGMGPARIEKSGNSWKYQRDISIVAKEIERWVVPNRRSISGESQIGQKVKWLVEESALGPPGQKTTCHLRYGIGYDRALEYFELARTLKLVKDKGSWFEFEFMGAKPPKFHGAQQVYEALTRADGAGELMAALTAAVDEKIKDYTL
jgi:archaellum biogenesis ATPase FlaH